MANVTIVRTASSSQIGSLLSQASASATYSPIFSDSDSLSALISDANGSGYLVFDFSPTLIQPTLIDPNVSIIKSGSTSGDAELFSDKTTGQIKIGNGLSTGGVTIGGISQTSGTIQIGGILFGGTINIGNGDYGDPVSINIGNGGTTNIVGPVSTGNISANGRITSTSVPAFSVYASFLQTQSGNLTYNATNSNNGGHMNLGTGLFTSPVAGYYQFNYYGFVDTGLGGNTTVTFQKNGSGFPSRAYNDFNDASYGPVITLSAVIYLAANDNVRVNITGAGMHGNDSSFFSGFLIG